MDRTRCTVASVLLATSCLLFSGAVLATAGTGEQTSTLANQESVAVTIYNNNLALIKDRRYITLPSGHFDLAWRDVSARIQPETALLRSISDPGSITVLEQNFSFDLLTPQSLLHKYVGHVVTVIRINPATGNEIRENATVLATSNGVVLKMTDRIETGIPGRIVFDKLPDNLRDRPTLVISGAHGSKAAQDLELSYLTDGLSWKADYVAELNDTDDRLDLSGWVTLINTSGSSYPNAKLQLVAGDVNQVQREFTAAVMSKARIAADTAAPVGGETLMEYHLYTFDRLTTIAENQTKQVGLFNASGIPAQKELMLTGNDAYYIMAGHGDSKQKVDVFIQFDNRKSVQLGMPLPQGTIRVYKRDTAGGGQFAGEDRIDHTPENETVRLKLGKSFDVTAERKQTDFRHLGASSDPVSRTESTHEITLKNAKQEIVTVTVQESIPGDWKIVEESQPHTKSAAHLALWKVDIPAEGTATLKYRAQVRH